VIQVKAVQPRVSSLLPALFLHTTAIERFASVSSMAPRRRNMKADALAAVGVTLRAVRDSSDVFPPLKSATAAVIIVWEMSKKVKSNKKDCKLLATRAEEIVRDVCRQTKDYGDQLPAEVQNSICQIEQIFQDIVAFMKELEDQKFLRRFARQDYNKNRIEQFNKLLDEAIQTFGLNLQIGVLQHQTAFQRFQLELDDVSRERHDEVLDMSRMSESEREQLLTKILAKSEHDSLNLGKPRVLFFFFSRGGQLKL